MVDQGIQNGFLKNITGFFVTDLSGDKTKEIKVGDVITKISGVDITHTNLAPLLFKSPDMLSLEIIRDGVTLQKTLPKQIISF
jgi:C-terminal processing protease CtpA/Prc